jgi:hypothetical protein
LPSDIPLPGYTGWTDSAMKFLLYGCIGFFRGSRAIGGSVLLVP